jgi:hypothetical protein
MFHFTDALSNLIADITARVPAFEHVRPERTLLFARRGRTGADGPNATCHCLTLPTSEPGYYFWADATTGTLTRRSPWFVTRSPEVSIHGTPVEYMISVALPRFSDQVSRRKLERYADVGLPPWVVRLDTVVHELYHIAPDAHGLRRLKRLVCAYLETDPAPEMLEVVRYDFATLMERHGGVVGTTFRDGSYPQRYVHVLEEQPSEPNVLVVPFKEQPGRARYTEADLVVRNFSRARPVVPERAA